MMRAISPWAKGGFAPDSTSNQPFTVTLEGGLGDPLLFAGEPAWNRPPAGNG